MVQALAENTNQSAEEIVKSLGKEAKAASTVIAQAKTETINSFLTSLAESLRTKKDFIIAENKKDLKAGEDRGLSSALLDRLALNKERIESMANGVETVRELDDPVDRILWESNRPNGLKIQRVSAPIGVLGMIYESRPNVTVDASILCLKSHNAVILRGGSESLNSSLALHNIIQDCLEQHGLPKGAVGMVPTRDRDAVGAMLRATEYIDVMIPRGGAGLIARVMEEARMPVFGHLEGLCHIYVHKNADLKKALEVTLNAKMRRTGICGAMETLLLDESLADDTAKDILNNILESGCKIVGDARTQSLSDKIGAATEEDWRTEYLDAKLSVKFVPSVEEAVNHINFYGSHHTDSIITEDTATAEYFLKNVDSGIVMHNASTQFADGGEFGMGAEIGIATGKMHARGPVALEQLCTYKYMVHGNGQTRP
ncbi:MAG: glutamate-5-semialdehyde dehydrogenase [Alphaproteobacteria bacterium]|nr:glutamate-5-semialdehyde dehydrogenase [Alphaproteobacteria bacterium]